MCGRVSESRKDTETAKRPFVPFVFFVSFVVQDGGDGGGGQLLVQRQHSLRQPDHLVVSGDVGGVIFFSVGGGCAAKRPAVQVWGGILERA